jgi:hypothetical protein
MRTCAYAAVKTEISTTVYAESIIGHSRNLTTSASDMRLD